MKNAPYAFICHASEDKSVAERMATDLRAAGIEAFFDKWEMRSGDSLRQKIDEGLGRCTHFIALLSRPYLRLGRDDSHVNLIDVSRLPAGRSRQINSSNT
jgi:hypothetical protein